MSASYFWRDILESVGNSFHYEYTLFMSYGATAILYEHPRVLRADMTLSNSRLSGIGDEPLKLAGSEPRSAAGRAS